MQFPLELHRNLLRAVRSFDAIENAAPDLDWHFEIHRPERKSDRVPAKISQTTGRFELAAGADIALNPLGGSIEAELTGDSPDGADTGAIVQDLTKGVHAGTVHEHHAVHELDSRLVTGINHRLHIGGRDSARLFDHDMLTRLSGFHNPFRANACRQRNVNSIHIVSGQQFFVAADRGDFVSDRHRGLTLGDKLTRFFDGSTCHGSDSPVA